MQITYFIIKHFMFYIKMNYTINFFLANTIFDFEKRMII